MKKYFIPLTLGFLLSACGFHLRGMIDVPEWLNNVALVSKDGDKTLVSILKSQLEGYKIHVNEDPAHADYWLIINSIQLQQHIISIGASTNPRQYQLRLTVEFMLQMRKGKVIMPPKLVSTTRQLTINNDRILGSTQEEAILVREMKKEVVVQIINRLSKD